MTLFGIIKSMITEPFRNKYFAIDNGLESALSKIILHQAARSVIFTCVKLVQFVKAQYPMLSILLGIVTEVKPVQYLKAPSPMLVTLYCFSLYVTFVGITIVPEYLLSPATTIAVLVSSLN